MPKGQIKEPSGTTQSSERSQEKSLKDVRNILEILDNPKVFTNPFGANLSGDNSYKRAERITAAIHLVTNHIPETEPLRLSIRRAAIQLLDCILELRSGFRSTGSEKGQSALAEIRSLISLTRLLAVAGYISSQNAHAVVEALDELGNLIAVSHKSTLAEQVHLSREDLAPPAATNYRTTIIQSDVRNKNKNVIQSLKKDTIGHREKSREELGRSGRILDILKVGGELGIRDISTNLPQYSEKMVQRELAALVDAGVVIKAGEKRWSRYRMATL